MLDNRVSFISLNSYSTFIIFFSYCFEQLNSRDIIIIIIIITLYVL